MARLTSEDAVAVVGNRYDLVLMASRRTRELTHGWTPKVKCDNGPVVTALREIEAGLIGREYLFKPQNIDRKERQPQDK
jgi:DNA-directed RNA polymerase subunit omega